MIKEGLAEEIRELLKKGVPEQAPALKGLGYGLAVSYIQNKIGREEFETQFIHQTRHYAKRQMTWFRANPRIHWIDVKEPFVASAMATEIQLCISRSPSTDNPTSSSQN